MTQYGDHPRLRRSTPPLDTAVWHWFICNGPHGERFSWHRDSPYPRRDVEVLREFMQEKEEAHPGFLEKARLIALEALADDDPIIVLTGVQVLTIVGTPDDLQRVAGLSCHPDERVVKNVRASLFERGIKVGKRDT